LTTKGSKLVAILLIVVVVAAGAGYWLLTPKIPYEVTGTLMRSSLLTPLERSETLTSSAVSISVTNTVAPASSNVNGSNSVTYYLSLLEANGSQPYLQLAMELRDLPDLTNATAVAEITYLALNATNPEVKQALELMLRVGAAQAQDFGYPVPKWNAELWGLYQLAEDSELQRDDMIALSIAIVDGVFRVIGDEQVQKQVRLDDANMLRLSREITKWQEQQKMAVLSKLPLDAAIYWAWRGTTTMDRGGYWAYGGGPYPLQTFRTKKMSLKAYLWDTIDPKTLRDMRADAEKLGWTKNGNIDSIAAQVEDYYYGYAWGKTGHWEYHYVKSNGDSDTIKNVDGVDVEYGEVQNTDWQYYQRFKKGLPGVGCCIAETALVDAWLKSVGISSDSIGRVPKNGGYIGHNHAIYYNPILAVWKAYEKQVELALTDHPTDVQEFSIRRLPIDCTFDSYHTIYVDLEQIKSMLVVNGVPSYEMQEWVIPPA
jgi:hypothetical protein